MNAKDIILVTVSMSMISNYFILVSLLFVVIIICHQSFLLSIILREDYLQSPISIKSIVSLVAVIT